MARIAGDRPQLTAHVERIVREHVPGASCAVLDYGKRIGCGEIDGKGRLHERCWLISDLDEDQVATDARRMSDDMAAADGRIETDC